MKTNVSLPPAITGRIGLTAVLPLIFLLLAVTVHAQLDLEAGENIELGANVSGRIDDRTPRTLFTFDALRGEVISIQLRATSGDLDPVLTLLDSSGAVLAQRDDSNNTRDPTIGSFQIPQTDRYLMIVGRFAYSLGTTAGSYELRLERVGVSGSSGSALRYGDSVIGNITSLTPQVYYSFQAARGDILNIEMKRVSGNLDPFLQVVNSSAFVIAENDDVPGSDSLNAHVADLIIEEAGTYVIIASRFGQVAGSSTGAFVLEIEETEESGLANSPQTAAIIQPGSVVEGELAGDRFRQFYRFEARRNDLITVRMERVSGNLDTFLTLTNAGFIELLSDDDGGTGQNSRIEDYLIPADGAYFIVATRFEGARGTTTGRYRLQLDGSGNVFQDVQADIQSISYGTTVTGRIDDETPETLYAFWGTEGEVITTSMNRGDGDLDPVLSILNGDFRSLVSNDDSNNSQNSRIERFVIPATGLYYLRAARFRGQNGNPNTAGSFILVLARRFD